MGPKNVVVKIVDEPSKEDIEKKLKEKMTKKEEN